jgi:hypothetical protein
MKTAMEEGEKINYFPLITIFYDSLKLVWNEENILLVIIQLMFGVSRKKEANLHSSLA